MIFFHGLAAFSGLPEWGNPLSMLGKAIKAMDGVEVSASEKPIGPIGLAVEGEILRIFDRDVDSTITKTGKRVIRPLAMNRMHREADQEIIKDDEKIVQWIEDIKEIDRKYMDLLAIEMKAMEVFMIPRKVIAVWVMEDPYIKNNFSEGTAKILSRRFGVRQITVNRKSVSYKMDC